MTGFEFKELLIDERVKFVELAAAMQLAPQTVQAKFRTRNVSKDFVAAVEEWLGKEPGYFEERFINKGKLPTEKEVDQINRLISLCETQSKQISDLLERQEQLIALIERNKK